MFEYILLLVIGGVGLLLFMFSEAHRNRVKIEKISFSSFPPGMSPFTIFFISDIHKREIANKIIDQVKTKTDFVIIGGDLLEKGVDLSKVSDNLDKLVSLGPVYFIWGNNDYEVDTHQLKNIFKEKGVIEIINDAKRISFNNKFFNLIGVDDPSLKRDSLPKALQEINPHDFNILLSHDPRLVKQVRKENGIDFMLSGHTHGGQIRLFGWGLYKKGGLEKLTQTILLVSNGYGTTSLPLRLGARSETHLITLAKE